MERLTAKQIIEKLKSIYDNVDDFAEELHLYLLSDYPEALKAQKVRDDFYKLNYNKDEIKWNSDEVREKYLLMPNEYDIAYDLWKKSLGLNWTEISCQGGEGQGDHWESVKYFPDDDVYLKVIGHYTSYDGVSFNGWKSCVEVRPQQKTITVYEKIE